MKIEPIILTHPNIPKPLHGLNPRTIKGQAWWDIERQKAYASTDYHCLACGVHKSNATYHQWLEAHEDYDIDYSAGTVAIKGIIPLCHSCHNFIHSGRMYILLQKGTFTMQKIVDILIHGFVILKENNLDCFAGTKGIANAIDILPMVDALPIPDKMAKWQDWKLILEGKEYYSKFESQEAWAEFYSQSY